MATENDIVQDLLKGGNPPIAGVFGQEDQKPKGGKLRRRYNRQIDVLLANLPRYSEGVNAQILPQAQAILEAQRQTSPQFAQMMADLYRQFGPELNRISSDINRQNALAQAETDRQVVSGPGRELVREAIESQRIADPEFFSTRELTAQRLAELLESIDLEGGLTGSERREIEQGLAREGSARGTLGAPSNLAAVSNAMRYGSAGQNRVNQNRSALSNAISQATSFLPQSRTGIDVFQVATGRSSMPNFGNSLFPGVNPGVGQSTQNTQGNAAGMGQNISGLQNNLLQIASQERMNEKDWADYLNQVTSSISDVASAAGSFAGMCWIARKVFGDSRWIDFRHYLTVYAPQKLVDVYVTKGQQIAERLTNNQAEQIRTLMEKLI